MRIKFKPGVSLKDMVPQLLVALWVAEAEFAKYGLDTVVTSVNDGPGVHAPTSYHYKGRAIDLRTKHAAGLQRGITAAIEKQLGPLGFDVILEGLGEDNEHLHIELDMRAGY